MHSYKFRCAFSVSEYSSSQRIQCFSLPLHTLCSFQDVCFLDENRRCSCLCFLNANYLTSKQDLNNLKRLFLVLPFDKMKAMHTQRAESWMKKKEKQTQERITNPAYVHKTPQYRKINKLFGLFPKKKEMRNGAELSATTFGLLLLWKFHFQYSLSLNPNAHTHTHAKYLKHPCIFMIFSISIKFRTQTKTHKFKHPTTAWYGKPSRW